MSAPTPETPAPERQAPKGLARIEVVEDLSNRSTLDDGFLRLRRLRVQNHYDDGTTSEAYACDLVTRRWTDAVAVVLHGPGPGGAPHVVLRTGVRPPVYLRGQRDDLPFPETADLRLIHEIVAGVLEGDDLGEAGLAQRASAECLEEAGYVVPPQATRALGGAVFPSPGVTDEKIYFRVAQVDLAARGAPEGDGSVMEEAGGVVILPLAEAIHRCRSGAIPDAKTELALLRLCDAIGYSAQLGAYYADLPLAARPDPERLAWLAGGDLPPPAEGAEDAAGAPNSDS